MNKAISVGMSALVLSLGMGALPAAAQATSCGRYVMVHSVHYTGYASYCPMWRGNVPVLGKTNGSPDPAKVVGYLYSGGSANWFLNHWGAGPVYRAYGYSSADYASTVADNGAKGWVSAVYFAGSQSYWAGLDEASAGYAFWG